MFLVELSPAGDNLLLSHSFGSGSQSARAITLDKENNIQQLAVKNADEVIASQILQAINRA